MKITLIAAIDRLYGIGGENKIPWHCKEDFKHFKDTTWSHHIVMGRKTYESFPKPLKNRLHVVITRQENYQAAEGVVICKTIEEAMEFCKTKTDEWGNEVFIIGGGEIYKQTLPIADQLYITEIDKEFDGDTKYPEFTNDFIIAKKDDRFDPLNFSFCLYTRKSQ